MINSNQSLSYLFSIILQRTCVSRWVQDFLRCCFVAVKLSPLAFLEILLPGVTVCVTYSLSDPEHTRAVSLIHGLQPQIELQPALGQDLLWQYPFVVDTPMHTHSHTHKDKPCLHRFITHAYPALFLISWYQCFLCHAMLAVIHYLSQPLVCLRYISIPLFPSPPIFWIPFHPPIDRFPLLSCTGKSVKPTQRCWITDAPHHSVFPQTHVSARFGSCAYHDEIKGSGNVVQSL